MHSNAELTEQEITPTSSNGSHPISSIESLVRDRIELLDGNWFKECFDIEGVNWKGVSQATKDFYWKEFKYFWDSTIEATIKATWKVKVVERYKDIMEDLKSTRNIPAYVSEEAWKLCEQYWNDPKVIQQSQRNSRNRHGVINGLGPFTHAGESISYVEWSEKLDAIVASREELSQFKTDSIDDNQIYLDVVGGDKRKKVHELEKQIEDERQVTSNRLDQLQLDFDSKIDRMRRFMMEEITILLLRGNSTLFPSPQN
ncbi:uncharacterized protein LOC110626092 [Manihot esculenta]|uniref:uncharacterized protein LOC110626092 n=1 Tax=Manihot esculenta TaxID=3983 RepID=UPI000B5D4A31|nr:uncharacterized protein LOC110626092 [Manihot esculenta]XP_043807522.1 uncharacterized protein LOC110626092 [Manihot esculenta]XP_043807524.1 uncharacterized protein LOC110626092 [Manihot esculenta]